jgi:enamine deaminase RidA (YjgF/YER057c/UK114 family)
MFVSAGSLTSPDTSGDVSSQTRGVLERARATLQRAGSSLDQALSVTVFLKSAADFQAMNAVYSGFWSRDYPTRTTVIVPPIAPGALVEMSFVAARAGKNRDVIHPENWLRSPSPYSYAIRSGDTVFLSGLVSRNGRDNSTVDGDVGVQTRVILDNAGELLDAAGLSHSLIASSRILLPQVGSFAPMNEAYRPYFPSQPPARATIRADLAGPQYSVEITFIASAAPRRALSSTAYPGLPLSSGIVAGRAVYLSGMLGFDDSNRTDVGSQTRATLAKLGRSLAEAGASPAHVVEAIVYVTDRKFLADVDREYAAFFGSHAPARTNIVCGLMAPDGLVEIMLTAELPESP